MFVVSKGGCEKLFKWITGSILDGVVSRDDDVDG